MHSMYKAELVTRIDGYMNWADKAGIPKMQCPQYPNRKGAI